MGKWIWKWSGKWPGSRRARMAISKGRVLAVEPLEPRLMLSGSPPTLADLLAKETPDPHPTGDQPTETARMISLDAYQPTPVPDLGGIPELESFFDSLRQIYGGILRNPQARPSYWGEQTVNGGDQYRLYLNDN